MHWTDNYKMSYRTVPVAVVVAVVVAMVPTTTLSLKTTLRRGKFRRLSRIRMTYYCYMFTEVM